MRRPDIGLFREWFAGFAGVFRLSDAEEQRNIDLKEEHTGRVCENIAQICCEERLDRERAELAEAIALFHDIGRFPQYLRYKTFRDSDSVNHGRLGAELLVKGRVLDKLSPNEQDIIITGVRFHNCLVIPPGLGRDHTFFLGLVRDADKLDIWRVFLEFYRLPDEERASAVSLGLPDLAGCSAGIVNVVCSGEMARLESVRCLNDFKLLQLSWVYDLNFASSFRMVRERNYIDLLAATLPGSPDVLDAIDSVRRFAGRNAQGC